MRLTQDQKFHRTTRWLRATFPPPAPITTVHTTKCYMKTLCGDCGFRKGDRFLIRINRTDPYQVKIDTILHEWAHVLTWFTIAKDDHSGQWGEAYARIYRAWCKWDFGREEN